METMIGNISAETSKLLGMHIDLDTKLRSGALKPSELEAFLDRRNPFPTPSRFRIWKHVTLGTFSDISQMLKKFSTGSGEMYELSPDARDLIHSEGFCLEHKRRTVYLTKVEVRDLGFDSQTTRHLLYEAAFKQGLVVCPAEVGPKLRLIYKDQSHDEIIQVGMNPISDSMGARNVFQLDNSLGSTEGGPHLDVFEDGLTDSSDEWIFVLP